MDVGRLVRFRLECSEKLLFSEMAAGWGLEVLGLIRAPRVESLRVKYRESQHYLSFKKVSYFLGFTVNPKP